MISFRKITTKAAIAYTLLITGLFGVIFFSSSCVNSNPENANSKNNSAQSNTNAENNPAKDDVSELLTIVRLPEIPDEVVWREESLGKSDGRAPDSTDKKITVVLKYNTETATKLIAQIEKNKRGEPIEIGTENWFPEELIAQSQISGNEMLKGTTYGPNDFLNLPYGNGKITRIENTNYFILELFTT